MWEKLFRFLCIYLLIVTVSAQEVKIMNCCDISEIVFKQKCTKWHSLEFGQKVTDVNCVLSPNEISNQELISQFEVSLMYRKMKDFYYCTQKLERDPGTRRDPLFELNIETITKVCNPYVNSVTLNTNDTTELSYLYDVTERAPHITQLRWRIHKQCQRVNEIITKFKQLKVLIFDIYNSVHLDNCEDFSLNGTKLTELHINLNKPDDYLSVNLKSFSFAATFLRDQQNLQQFTLNCTSNQFEIDLPRKMFQGLTELSQLSLENCEFNKLTPAHFQDLINLRVLNLSNAKFDDFDWFR